MSDDFPAALLCDMDGTLIDTEPYWTLAERELVERFGGEWTDALEHQLVGCGPELLVRSLTAAGVKLPSEEIVHSLSQQVKAQLSEAVPWRPGAEELLHDCYDHQIPMALVTMSTRLIADYFVERTSVPVFRSVVTGECDVREKPHPAPYVRAAEQLDVSIVQCVAIEDSRTGVKAALASGAVTIGVPHHVQIADLRPHALWENGLTGRTWQDLVEVFHSAR